MVGLRAGYVARRAGKSAKLPTERFAPRARILRARAETWREPVSRYSTPGLTTAHKLD